MNTKPDVYLFGQVLGTHSFLLKGGFLRPDEYAEIEAQYFLPGGETGTAATVLDSLGVSVRMDGTWIGTEVAPMLQAFYRDRQVDLSPLHLWEDDPGVMDYVVIAGLVRSPMGRFQALFSTGKRWWSVPQEKDIVGCEAAAIDPFFGEESFLTMEICRRYGIPYVTIDSPHDSPLHQGTQEEALQFIVNHQLAPSVLARSAFCEQAIGNAVRLGCRQIVIYACGYDTFSLRTQSNAYRV